MSDIPLSLRKQVIETAFNRCEYCHLSQESQEATFHIDHVKPRSSGGKTTMLNLALSGKNPAHRRIGPRVLACNVIMGTPQ